MMIGDEGIYFGDNLILYPPFLTVIADCWAVPYFNIYILQTLSVRWCVYFLAM